MRDTVADITITLRAGEIPLLKVLEWTRAAQQARNQGDGLTADRYQSLANFLSLFLM
jgi:hypothetical protein